MVTLQRFFLKIFSHSDNALQFKKTYFILFLNRPAPVARQCATDEERELLTI